MTNVSSPSLTAKDAEDLEFGLEHDVDWVALSFVRTAHDMREIKGIIEGKGKKTKVIAKIEKPQAVLNIDEIIEETDGIMVARGDLGVEMPMEDVPNIQRMLINKSNAAGKPVIVATQMLESMIENPRPTRAEANDVATAVMAGTDAVMLSAETASGAYPNLAVAAMSRIIGASEAGVGTVFHKHYDLDKKEENYLSNSVIASACILAKNTEAKAICALTSSGYTGIRASHHRPDAPIYIFTRRPYLLTQLSLVWGVRPIYFERKNATDETVDEIKHILKDRFGLLKGDNFILIASIPLNERGRANMIKLTKLD
jgi:pyruvate kinase